METELEVKFKTTLGDSFNDNIKEKDKQALIEQHIQDFCGEHNIERKDVKIVKSKAELMKEVDEIIWEFIQDNTRVTGLCRGCSDSGNAYVEPDDYQDSYNKNFEKMFEQLKDFFLQNQVFPFKK